MAYPLDPVSLRRPWPYGIGMSKMLVVAVLCVVIAIVAGLALFATLFGITLAFGTPTSCGPGCWDIVVTGVSQARPLSDYTVVIDVDPRASTSTAPLVPGPVFGEAVRFTDAGASGVLDAGDSFRFEDEGVPARCHLGVGSLRAYASVSWAC